MKGKNGKQKQKQQKQNLGSRAIRRKGPAPSRSLPASYVAPFSAGPPRFSTVGKRTIIQHSEEFAEVVFSQFKYALNSTVGYPAQPGRSITWPWLGGSIGPAFETYRIRKLEFEYLPQVGSAHDGFIAMTFDFDSRDSAPNSLQQLLANDVKYENPCYLPGRMSVPPRQLSKLGKDGQLYVRLGNQPQTGGDLKTYDAGRLWVATGGAVSGDNGKTCGILVAHYDIEFETPQLNIPAQIKQATLKVDASSTDRLYPLGNTPTVTGGLDWTLSGNTIRTNEPGQFLIDCLLVGTGLATGDLTITSNDASSATVSTPIDIANTGGTLEAVTFLINQPGVQRAVYTIAAAGATTIATLVMRCAKYSPSSHQMYDESTGYPLALNEIAVLNEE